MVMVWSKPANSNGPVEEYKSDKFVVFWKSADHFGHIEEYGTDIITLLQEPDKGQGDGRADSKPAKE